MIKKNGFSLIELLIVVTILGFLAVAVLTAFNPIEQINRSRDTATLNTANELLNALMRSAGTTDQSVLSNDVQGLSLASPSGQIIIKALISRGEMKKTFAQQLQTASSPLYLTGTTDLSSLWLCFVPRSRSYRTHNLTIFNQAGQPVDCTNQPCYFCLNQAGRALTADGTTPAPTSPPADPCANFNPERPEYGFTCNFSDKWSQYQCTNYCIRDFGCDSYCPAGQRHLVKDYYARGLKFFSCFSHDRETQEDYCVSGAAANCDAIPYQSSDLDYLWGCTNPRRPYAWK